MILRREACRRRFDEDIVQAKTAAREASLVVERAQQALVGSVGSAAAGATAASLPSTRLYGVSSQRPRPGDAAFFKGSVACMTSAPRGEFSPALATAVVKSSRPNNHMNNSRHFSGQSRGYHQDQGHKSCHNDTTYTSDHHGGIPRSPAFSALAPAPRVRFGAAHNPAKNTHVRQPGAFRSGSRQLDSGTSASAILSGTPLSVSADARVLILSLSKNAR